MPPAKPLESWRLFFPAAAALAVAGLGAWGAQLAGAPLGLSPGDHGAFMLWGVLGTGVQGFLLTAYAKQNDAPLPSRPVLYGVLSAQALSAGLLRGRPAAQMALRMRPDRIVVGEEEVALGMIHHILERPRC